MPTNAVVGLAQVLVPFIGQLLVSKGYLPANIWTDIGTIIMAVAGAGWSATTTNVANQPAVNK